MTLLAPSMQAWFTDRLINQRDASPRTITAYRDTMRLLLTFASEQTGKLPSRLDIDDLDAPMIGAFLDYLEQDRGNSPRTRNARLAAIHSLYRYSALRHPEHAHTIARVIEIPNKRYDRTIVSYLEQHEIKALLRAPDRTTWLGRRDHALLLTAISYASEFVSEIRRFVTPSRCVCNDAVKGSDGREEEYVRTTGCQPSWWAPQAGAERGGEAADLAAVVDGGADAAPGGRALGGGSDDDHADPSRRARGRVDGAGQLQAWWRCSWGCGRGAGGGARGDRQVGGDGQGAGDRAGGVAGKSALGLVGRVPARVEVAVKARLLELIAQATGAGWSFGKACGALGLGERRARYWQKRAAAGALADRKPGGTPVHALRPEEVDAILGLADQWGEIDGSHRKLAHRGSYLGRVWVSPSTVLRVLLEHGRALPWRPPRQKSLKRPWPEWVQYKPRQVWGYDFIEFPQAGTSALAILDLVSRKWIETMLCPEATDVQVQVLFTRALEREGLLDVILSLIDEHAAGEQEDELEPILLSVSDNGAQMRSGSTREFMALHAIATHYGRPGTPTDQAHIESLFGHVKYEWPYLCALKDPADLSRELDAVREQYNRVRLHAGIGYVTPDDEHEGRGPAIREARRAGLARAREQRLAYNRGTHPRLIG